MLLAVETSGTLGSIAIADGPKLLASRILAAGGVRHAQSLVTEVDKLLQELALTPTEIRSVAVSIGPGSFTGLRVGLVFAKTFAWLNQSQLVAVDTLRAIAQQAPHEEMFVTAVVDAQRGEMFAGTYRFDSMPGCRQLTDPIRVTSQDALPKDYLLTGPGLSKLRPQLAAEHRLQEESSWQPRASTIAQLGQDMVGRKEFSIPETLEPVYVRLSYAEEKRDLRPTA
ncbi:MAG: tRNA (adenosine(37)-N6)-threonylcarbamoyltransferase complex dimerization subunit type 1 TsaB [Planctomycetaceae bacterium]